MSKNLVVNAATCDARKVSEETLSSYENIKVNAATLLTTPDSRTLLHKFNVAMNCAKVVEVPENADIVFHNGKYTLSAKNKGEKPAILTVNGILTIEPGSEEAIKRFVSIIVNGKVLYPESMSPYLGNMNVNGTTEVYPDDAIMLKQTFIVDKTFVLRSKSSKYYARKCVVLIDPSLDVGELVNKGVLFLTETAIVAQSLLSASIPLFEENTEIITVPDGCAFVSNNATLDKVLLRKHGTKLFINGNLKIDPSAGELLEKIEYLRVKGTVSLPKTLEDLFFSKDFEYDDLKLVRGKCIDDKVFIKVDNKMLEQNTDGVSVIDCVNVTIADDVSPDMILERLELNDCVNVVCTPEQRSAVEQVASDVVNISDSGKGGLGDILKGLMPNANKDSDDTMVINSAYYVL
jgi:hypothetical protein